MAALKKGDQNAFYALAVLAAALTLTGCETTKQAAKAATPMNCAIVGKAQFSEVLARVRAGYSDLKEIVLRDEKRDVFLRAFNASPPVTNYTANTIYIFHSRQANRNAVARGQPDTSYMVMVDRNGCVQSSGEVETKDVVRWVVGEVTKRQGASGSDPRFPSAPTRRI